MTHELRLDLGDRNDLTWAQRIVYVIHAATACDRALALWADRALALWAEEEQKVADQVAQLQRQIDQLGDGVCVAVADRLDEDMPDVAAGMVAPQVR